MAELQEALKYLGPADWSSIPREGEELDSYLAELFEKSQLIVDSVPLPSPEDAPQQPEAQARGRAKNASEVTLSSERPPPPPFGHEKFQKEWGKPMKIKPQENLLGLSVYKMPGKDSKGSWFARHSIHEGIGFARFKRSLEIEFEKSLAEHGPPGSGNVRGIGGEERVEQIKRGNGTVEVYRLSAQFPGPTAARDFVTMLVTSDNALKVEDGTKDKLAPRHYMIISKPCDHPKTQPRNGFVRGYYESVEFIREVPRKLKTSQSSIDISSLNHPHKKHHEHHVAHQRTGTCPPDNRPRSATATPLVGEAPPGRPDPTDPEDNPVEWIMITRSDPGGGIPRFLVERGTPSSICGDAVKFVDWACQNDEDVDESGQLRSPRQRRESYQSWKGRSVVSVAEKENEAFPAYEEPQSQITKGQPSTTNDEHHGMLDTVAGAATSLRPYTPQVILDHLPASGHSTPQVARERSQQSSSTLSLAQNNDDAKSVASSTSFASAEDHWSSASDEAEAKSLDSTGSVNALTSSKEHLHHEKELRKLDDRKQALHKKFAEHQSKMEEARAKQAQENEHQTQKASEKHDKQLKRHQEKFQKELAKIEKKQERERRKAAEKAKKQADKDENARLRRERDEAKQELELAKKEVESLRSIVAELQKENTGLVMKLGKAGFALDSDGSRSRGSSLSRKGKKPMDKDKDLATASAAASMKSATS